LPDQGRATAPGSIQLPGLPAVAGILRESRSHPSAVFQADARHRHQIFHRHVRRDSALAHLLLDRLRQEFNQRQPSRHPTYAAVKAAPQFLQTIAEVLLHLRQQPPLFQCGLVIGESQRTVEQQSLGFAHRPDHRGHRVPAQELERRDPLVAVDDQVTVWLAFGGHHYDRRLLPRFGQRGQQPPLLLRMADSQMLPAPIELVKLQLHGGCSGVAIQYGADGNWSFPAGGGSVARTFVGSIRYERNWSFAERTRSDPITPMKSDPFCPNSSFARSQGSWPNGRGKRSASGACACAPRCWMR
jgi:hypothetical protein